jgi:hypothetical protein
LEKHRPSGADRSSESAQGKSEALVDAFAKFAISYTRQTEQDHEASMHAKRADQSLSLPKMSSRNRLHHFLIKFPVLTSSFVKIPCSAE